MYKYYAAEGGIRVPAIVSGPKLNVPVGRLDSLIMAYDIAPTFLELAGADATDSAGRGDVTPITGRSFAAALRGEPLANARGAGDPVGREHAGQAAIRRGDWKLLWVGNEKSFRGEDPAEGSPPPQPGEPRPCELLDAGSPAGTPIGEGGPWQLFNLRDDPAERQNLAEDHPEVVAELLRDWDSYVAENGVIVKSGCPVID